MNIIVQKFGGTSVKTKELREQAAGHIEDAVREGYKVVVVVSAMGRSGDPYATDTLLSLIDESAPGEGGAERDLLVSCGETISAVVFTELLRSKQLKAAALNGAQAGFITDSNHGNAKIIDMRTEKVEELLATHDAVVVTGFQGVSEDGMVTTLGRGGSDTSATALGTALKAEWVDIFTDVEGMMTADPRVVEDARLLSTVTYQEICNMAYQGAKVIHPRAVEIAMQGKVPIRIRSTSTKEPGTLITSMLGGAPGREVAERLITGIAHIPSLTQISVTADAAQSEDMHARVFQRMESLGLSVDFINIGLESAVFTVPDPHAKIAVDALEEDGWSLSAVPHCAKVSVVGAGMTGVPGVASKIVTALSEAGVPILQSADSHTTIWALVREQDTDKAVAALHRVFDLGRAGVRPPSVS
ncbi:aspartate kinase [Marinococcus luteus]|uniref:aspartate kinase n=1 Tax=Marinococcus luteus TaxID=1122204 RepID=UPI002ACCBD41|nr:aspartate kinase [Marinococcus luteus]MDZ5781857.1 aspartate kinase [Marinococcus luteus]